MKYYKVIRICRLCKKRFVVENSKSRKYYCTECQSKFTKDMKKQKEA